MKNIIFFLPFIFIVSSAYSAEKTQALGLNPDIGANFLTLFQRSSNPDAVNNGFRLQEAEVQFQADVDIYFTAKALLSVEQDAGAWGIKPEEVFAESTFIPKLTLKAGKFFAAFGKHNGLHTHAFPFIDAPLGNIGILGDDSLNEAGFSASYLIPVGWFSEFTVQALSDSSTALFRDGGSTAATSNSLRAGDLMYDAKLKNLWDINDDSTVELGVSGLNGKNNYAAQTNVFGADLTFKYKPTDRGIGKMFVVGLEGIQAYRNGFSIDAPEKAFGFNAFTQYEFLPKTFAEYRFDGYLTDRRHSVLFGFAPSEFSMFRIQYSLKQTQLASNEHVVMLQTNFSIGAHPAHDY